MGNINKGRNISQLENKKNLPSMEVFMYICEHLGIAPKDFFDDGVAYPEKIASILTDLNKLSDEQLDNIAGIIKAIASKSKGD